MIMINLAASRYFQRILVLGLSLGSLWVGLLWAGKCAAENSPSSAFSATQFQQLQSGFYRLLEAESSPSIQDWQALGISLTEDEQYVYLQAQGVSAFDLGKVIVRKHSVTRKHPLMIQVPHQFYDRHSADIGRSLFAAGGVAVYMENTVHRHSNQQTDLSTQQRSTFSAFAIAYRQHHPAGKVVQIHGFSSAKRKTAAGRYADIIISNGSPQPDQQLLALQACLEQTLMLVTRVFGLDVFELGATTNITGRLLNQQAIGGFIHIELSDRVRQNYPGAGWIKQMRGCL